MDINRRNFLRTSVLGGLGIAYAGRLSALTPAGFKSAQSTLATVALTTGNSRADMVFRALLPFAETVRQQIGNKQIVIKPNLVSTTIQLAATHVETIEGVLEFLKSINKLNNVIIAESAAGAPAFEGYDNFGYIGMAEKYKVTLKDLDQEKYEKIYVFDERDFKPHPVRMSSVLLSPDAYIISVARMKTHDRIIATLSLKNIILGAPIKDPGFAYGASRKPGAVNDKPIVHGGGYRGINYNLSVLANRLHPHLAIVDGFEGMEGNGPNNGTSVDHRVCVAGTDWLAVDRVGIELMGIDYNKIGYLNYCEQTGLGVADLGRIEVLGESVADHIIKYKLHDSIEKQLIWMNPVS